MGSLLTLFSRLTVGSSAPFVPTDISGLSLWLKADDAATVIDTAGAVDQWNDKSGNGNNVTATLTQRPTTGTRTLNSKNALNFDGANNVLICPSGLFAVPNGPNTVFFAYASDNTGPAIQSLLIGTTVGLGTRYQLNYTTTALGVQNRSTSNLATTMADARSTASKIAGFRRSGVNITPFINGVQGTPGTNSENFTASFMNIGAPDAAASVNELDGIIGEILIYDSALSDADMNRVGDYLEQWGASWTAIGIVASLSFNVASNSQYWMMFI